MSAGVQKCIPFLLPIIINNFAFPISRDPSGVRLLLSHPIKKTARSAFPFRESDLRGLCFYVFCRETVPCIFCRTKKGRAAASLPGTQTFVAFVSVLCQLYLCCCASGSDFERCRIVPSSEGQCVFSCASQKNRLILPWCPAGVQKFYFCNASARHLRLPQQFNTKSQLILYNNCQFFRC